MRTFTPVAEVARLQSLRIDLNSCEFSDSRNPLSTWPLQLPKNRPSPCRVCNRCGTRIRPPRSSKVARPTDPVSGWKTWQKHLRTRKKPSRRRFIEEKATCAAVGLAAAIGNATSYNAAIVSPTTLAEIAIGEDAIAAPDLPLSLQLVALAYALPKLGAGPAGRNVVVPRRAVACDCHAGAARTRRSGRPTRRTSCETSCSPANCRWRLVTCFPKCGRSVRSATTHVPRSPKRSVELTDGQGLPHARLLARARSAVRLLDALPLARQAPAWRPPGRARRSCNTNGSCDTRFGWPTTTAGSFCRRRPPDMAAAMSTSTANDWNKTAFRNGDPPGRRSRRSCAAASDALPRGVVPKKWQRKSADLPAPSLNSDWAGVTIMADGWAQTDARLAVAYAGDPTQHRAQPSMARRCLPALWDFETRLATANPSKPPASGSNSAGRPASGSTFWNSAVTLTDGLRLERQILFGREDRVLYLADIIFATDGAQRRLQHSFEPAARARHPLERRERNSRRHARRPKIRAPFCRLRSANGGPIRAADRSASATASSCSRKKRPAAHSAARCSSISIASGHEDERTWRQLTVAEWMEIVAARRRRRLPRPIRRRPVALLPLARPGRQSHGARPEHRRRILRRPLPSSGKFKEWIEIEAV